MSRYQEPVRYYVAPMYNMGFVLEEYTTPDAAFFAAKALSQTVTSWLVVWSKAPKNARRVRAFAYQGDAMWARECPKCKGNGSEYYACSSFGAVRP